VSDATARALDAEVDARWAAFYAAGHAVDEAYRDGMTTGTPEWDAYAAACDAMRVAERRYDDARAAQIAATAPTTRPDSVGCGITSPRVHTSPNPPLSQAALASMRAGIRLGAQTPNRPVGSPDA